ncbi:hypothetical protein [Marilutibacter aestuarii]|uniref:hypothetical protein n=1 Tax=Marilutibacter aestuarii TaxID=1706195 RepID=UPI001FE34766|nr:hypothetical protein [Lysobacter aestuarii]
MLVLLAVGLAGAPAHAQDARIKQQLDAIGHDYEVDDDGDYRMVFETENGRSQLVFVISNVERYGSHQVREIWAPAYQAPGDDFPAVVANKLLEDSEENKLGAWVKQGDMAVYVVKIDAQASNDALDDAIEYAVKIADQMEIVLTDGDDEF